VVKTLVTLESRSIIYMNITRSATSALVAFAAAALLAACSSAGTQLTSPGSGVGVNPSASHVVGPMGLHGDPGRFYLGVKWMPQHRDHRKSWVDGKPQLLPRLLFAADAGTGDVCVMRLPQMILKGCITGFELPQGMCSDTKGNIYVADTQAQEIYVYSRAMKPVTTIQDTYGFPASCAINPTNNAIAVTNYEDVGSGGVGSVLLYSSPSSSPTQIRNPDGETYAFAGYDTSGDLWVDGTDTSGNFLLSFCGASSCSTITLSGGAIYQAGAVQWDNVRNTWVVFDQYCNNTQSSCSYPVSSSGTLGSPTTYLNFRGTLACDIVQGLIAANGKKYVAGGDNEYCGYADSTFSRWAYTGGGKPTDYETVGVDDPAGVAISTK
jgi:hypothetical protein